MPNRTGSRGTSGQPAPFRLLLVSPTPPPNGGIGKWTVLLLDWLAHRPNILVRLVDISPRWRGVADLSIPKRLVGGSVQGLRDLCHVMAGLLVFRADLMHLTTPASLAGIRDIVFLSLARLCRVPAVYHIRVGTVPKLAKGGGWEWRLLRCAFWLARKVIVIDQASYTTLRGLLPPGKTVLLPNCIALDSAPLAQEGFEDGTRRILFLGWVIPGKGVSELMSAWKMAARRGWELIVAGPGDTAYRDEAIKLSGGDVRVRFLGPVSQPEGWKLMQQADVFVLPSYTEGFPNVILEAMAAGKAIVATPVGAIPEMLDAAGSTPCGVIVDAKDAQGLAAALSRLMCDSALRDRLGTQARAKVERSYNLEAVFNSLLGLWREVS